MAPTDELLNRVFNLAYFILGDRTSAIYVAVSALDKIKIAAAVQDRRLYYFPTGRSGYRATRTKVNFGHGHLLQRLVYAECEPFERLLEGQGKAFQHDLIIRFIKHLVRVTTKHNSFYVVLGLCRVLHNYSTTETAEVYNLIIQDPDRGRDDYYYRSRKKFLFQQLKMRFGDSLRTIRGYRGEERFESDDNPGRFIHLVRECLLRFTPWESECVLPTDIEPSKSAVTPFIFEGSDPDEEHEIELKRIHTLIHPECFERVLLSLGLEVSARRLEIPWFAISSGEHRLEERLKPSELSKGELDAIRRALQRTSTQRTAAETQCLSILVDGDYQTFFDIKPKATISIDLGDDAEFIEFWGLETDEAVPLAICPVSRTESDVVRTTSLVTLDNGPRLSLTFEPRHNSSNGKSGATVRVNYVATASGRVVTRLLDRLGEAILHPLNAGNKRYVRLAFGSLLILVSLSCLWYYLRSRQSRPTQDIVAVGDHEANRRADDVAVPLPTPYRGTSDQPSPGADKPPTVPNQQSDRRLPRRTSQTGNSNPGPMDESQEIRGRRSNLDSTRLLAVRYVHVEPLGDTEMRELLIRNLRASSRFIVVESRDQADAVFRGSARRIKVAVGTVSVSLRLVNAKGQVIWSTTPIKNSRNYSGGSRDVAHRLVSDLLADIHTLERSR